MIIIFPVVYKLREKKYENHRQIGTTTLKYLYFEFDSI